MNKELLAEIIHRLLFEATPDEIRNALADIGLTCTSEHIDEILNGPKEERH